MEEAEDSLHFWRVQELCRIEAEALDLDTGQNRAYIIPTGLASVNVIQGEPSCCGAVGCGVT